jgi:predicted Zn-dependent protease
VLRVAKNDPATYAVTENNFVVARAVKATGKPNHSDSLKRLDAQLAPMSSGKPLALTAELESRLTEEQKEALHCNRAVLLVAMGRLQQAGELVGALEAAFPASTTVAMLRAIVLNANGKVAEAEATLAAKFPDSTPLEPLLLRVQFIAATEPERAADLLNGITNTEFANSPAVIATKVSARTAHAKSC